MTKEIDQVKKSQKILKRNIKMKVLKIELQDGF